MEYLPCNCKRCVPRHRSIYVYGFSDRVTLDNHLARELSAHFGRWGQVETVQVSHRGRPAAFVR